MILSEDYNKSGGGVLLLYHCASTFVDALTAQQDKNWARRGLKSCEDCNLYGSEECPYFEKYGGAVEAVQCPRKGFFIPDEQDNQKRREVLPVDPTTKEKERFPLVVWTTQEPPKSKSSIVSFWIALEATGQNWAVDTKKSRRENKSWLVDLSQCLDFLAYVADRARLSAKGKPPTVQITTRDFLDFVGIPYTKKVGQVYTEKLTTGLVCLSCLCMKAGGWEAWGGVIDFLHKTRTNCFLVTLKPHFFRLIRTAPSVLKCPALDGLRLSDTALFILGNEILKRSSSYLDRKRGTAEALKVSTLLDYVSSFISGRYNQKEKRRAWLEEKLDALKAKGVFSRYWYTRAGQTDPLTLEEVKSLNLREWKACLVRWDLDEEAVQLLEERNAELEEKRIPRLEQKEAEESDTSRKDA